MSSETPRVIRLGIIGTGLAVEQLHWPALRQLTAQFTVVAFANHSREKAAHFASYSGVGMEQYHEDYHDLLRRDDVDAVLISLPIPLNYPITREALQAGKAIICEKPAGSNLAEGQQFLALSQEFPNQVVLVAENFFYRDDLRLARALIDAGAIGRLHLLAWRNVSQLIPKPGTFSSTPWRHDPGYLGGPHLDAGVHHTAQIRLLCGAVQRLYGEVQDANTTHGGPSDLTLTLRFINGAVGSYTASYPELAVPAESNALHLYGDEGTLVVANRQVSLYRPGEPAEQHRFTNADGGYYNEFLNFYDALVHNEPLIGTIAQSYQNLVIIARGLESAESGRAIELDEAVADRATYQVPLWHPRGQSDLFAGLPCSLETTTGQ